GPSTPRSGPLGPGGMDDYRGPLRPAFRLNDLAPGALAAVAREFHMQSHLLVCSGELALRERFGEDDAREMAVATFVGAGWVVSERLVPLLGDGLDRVLALHPMLPPGFDRSVEVDGHRVRVTLTPTVDGLLDPSHPGCPGLLARGDQRGVEAMVHGVAPTAAVALAV